MFRSGLGLYKDNPENRLQDIEVGEYVLCTTTSMKKRIKSAIKPGCRAPVLLGKVTNKRIGILNEGADTEIDVLWFYAEDSTPSGKFKPINSSAGAHLMTNGLALRNVLNIRPNVNSVGATGIKLDRKSVRTLMDKDFSCMNKYELLEKGNSLTIVEKEKGNGKSKSSASRPSASKPASVKGNGKSKSSGPRASASKRANPERSVPVEQQKRRCSPRLSNMR